MRTKGPVGLKEGDEFVTKWGSLEIIKVDYPYYDMKDTNTGERKEFHHDELIDIMVGSVYGYE